METSDMSVIARYDVLTAAMVRIQVFSDGLLCHLDEWLPPFQRNVRNHSPNNTAHLRTLETTSLIHMKQI